MSNFDDIILSRNHVSSHYLIVLESSPRSHRHTCNLALQAVHHCILATDDVTTIHYTIAYYIYLLNTYALPLPHPCCPGHSCYTGASFWYFFTSGSGTPNFTSGTSNFTSGVFSILSEAKSLTFGTSIVFLPVPLVLDLVPLVSRLVLLLFYLEPLFLYLEPLFFI